MSGSVTYACTLTARINSECPTGTKVGHRGRVAVVNEHICRGISNRGAHPADSQATVVDAGGFPIAGGAAGKRWHHRQCAVIVDKGIIAGAVITLPSYHAV